MIAYIKELANELTDYYRQNEPMHNQLMVMLEVLTEELNKLEPRDFVVGTQFEFVRARRDIRSLSKLPLSTWHNHCQSLRDARRTGRTDALPNLAELPNPGDACTRIRTALDHYAGAGSNSVVRSFKFMTNSDVRIIVERDYKELSQILLPGHAWKSAVVMAGSILEAILYDLLTRDPATISRAMASPAAPPQGHTPKKDITKDTSRDEWKLIDLIDVTFEMGLLPKAQVDSIHQILREFRNFIHPKKEKKASHPCDEAVATLAKGALDYVCNHLDR